MLIDFGYWGAAPVGFDLQCLLVGDVQIGKRSASTLAEVDETIIPAYVEGLRAEGCDIPEAVVRRGARDPLAADDRAVDPARSTCSRPR